MTIKEKPLKSRNLNNPQLKSYTEAVRRGQKNLHVVFRKEKGWEVKKIAEPKGRIFSTQVAAIGHAKKIAKSSGADVFLHGQNGLIRERMSYYNHLED